ncbi:MAG: aspartate aminotransferase family protein [Clostridiales bacterium]|nr:aspartate aminotransferase family protein [Clostridiales bacterium]
MNNPYNFDTHLNTYNKKPTIFTKGKGSWLFDEKGNGYLDFVSGIAVNSLGHCPDVIVDAIKDQAEQLLHISNLYWNKPQLELSQLLIQQSKHNKVFFCNSGTEAVEAALKLSRKYGKSISPEKTEIVYFKNSFHGRSIGALSVTGNDRYQEVASPLMPNTTIASVDDHEQIKQSITDKTCAVIIEPIQGEGGILTISNATLKLIQSCCKKQNALLIFDEIQCGIGRTGTFFAFETTEVTPDIICLAKGLGGGVPIGAVIANEMASVFVPGDHGSTFGGNPLVCAVASKVTEIISEPLFLNEVIKKGHSITEKLNILKEKHPILGTIKGRGLLIGIEINHDAMSKIVDGMYKEKVLLVTAGTNTIRVLPPLNVNDEDIKTFITKLEIVLSNLDLKN